ncbi:MAG TPA: hypothetical protein VHU24_06730, partial [Solirubrobacterales bacterium]|nr:hypothetical protein [Solirubrobacterales bacterium]
STEVAVDEREPESVLRWQAVGGGEEAWIEVELAEKGWGTNVSVSAEGGEGPTKLEGWLDAVLDELATPTKRPFADMGEAPAAVPDLPDAPEPEIAVVEEAPPEAAPDEPVEEEAPAPESPPPQPAAPEPKKKRRRFFGF